MEKFKNKYRITSVRAQWWDYGWNGAYFITICTQNREHFFGEIINKVMQLSAMGQIAHSRWYEIPSHFPSVELGDFVVMLNHIHGILILDKPHNSDADANDTVETRLIASLQGPGGFAGNKNPMFHNNISRIIRWYKGRCSFEIRKIHADFAWQPRFYDHVIRNYTAYQRISNYIVNNPINWPGNKFYP